MKCRAEEGSMKSDSWIAVRRTCYKLMPSDIFLFFYKVALDIHLHCHLINLWQSFLCARHGGTWAKMKSHRHSVSIARCRLK